MLTSQPPYTQNLCGCWKSELKSTYLHGKQFIYHPQIHNIIPGKIKILKIYSITYIIQFHGQKIDKHISEKELTSQNKTLD